MFTRNKAHFEGLDCSGPNKVLPPTFCGVKELVRRVGESSAFAQFAHEPEFEAEDDAPKDLVRDLLSDLPYMDAVERQTAIREFSEFVNNLNFENSQSPAAGGGPASGAQGEPPKEGEPAAKE